MNIKFVPGQLDFVLHCYTTPEPYPYLDAPATKEWIKAFLADGIILVDEDHEGHYIVTAKGEAWVLLLCNTPYPEQRWVDPRRPEEDE